MFTPIYKRIIAGCLFVFVLGSSGLGSVAQQKRLLQVDDLFRVKEILDLQISPSGNEVLWVQSEISLKDNRRPRTIWRMPTDGSSEPTRLTDSEKDYSPRWSADGRRVAFLSTRSESPQVWLLDLDTHKLDQLTNSPTGVLSFSISPNGQHLAYTAMDESSDSFERNIHKNDQGVVVDKETFVVYQLLRNQIFLNRDKSIRLSLVNLSSRQTKQLDAIRYVEDYDWSPDSRSLALTTKQERGYKWSSDISRYDLDTDRLSVVVRGQQGESLDQMASYSSPIWSPDGTQILVGYLDLKDRWASVRRFGVYDFHKGKLTLITNDYELEPTRAKLFWNSNDTIYMENTVKEIRGLFRLSPKNGQVQPVINSGACDDIFTFSSDRTKVAYVHQSLQEPPEIIVSSFPFTNRKKLTSLNKAFSDFQLPQTEKMIWKSPDGTEIEGKLFKPIDYRSGRSYPLLVLVHGGPTIPLEDRFEPYTLGSEWLWAYPFRIFASRGYLVFLPDYRGTESYGKKFLEVRDLVGGPSADIISGIDVLIKKGMADPNQLGILGQSHGGWLGPVIMAHHRIFKAASFAEGSGNLITNYGQMPGWSNLNFREYYYGSPYDNPERYVELSPVFHMRGLNTPTLLEYGEQSLAVQGLDMLTALWRQGVPHEMVIYPRTGHNISSPTLWLESVNRNLDWFDYWMLGKREPEPSKRQQYARWDAMKSKMEQMRTSKSSRK